MEVAERQSISSLLNLVVRLINMMDFLKLFSGEPTVLKQTVDLASDSDLDILTGLKFKDLLGEEQNTFVRRVISCACDAKHGEGKDQKNRSLIANRIC